MLTCIVSSNVEADMPLLYSCADRISNHLRSERVIDVGRYYSDIPSLGFAKPTVHQRCSKRRNPSSSIWVSIKQGCAIGRSTVTLPHFNGPDHTRIAVNPSYCPCRRYLFCNSRTSTFWSCILGTRENFNFLSPLLLSIQLYGIEQYCCPIF